MKAKTKLIIAAAIIIITIGTLMVMGISSTSGNMVTVQQVLAADANYEDRLLRIEADLVPGSVNWSAEKVELTFQVTDGERKLNVLHHGIQPDNFYEGVEVILQGRYHDSEELFIAESVQTRCPSSYEEDVREQGTDK
ncbi:cytochrome c-type biogenesis protein CcmE [Desulfitispora alkaliphila]|uniref:cytochrome c maturation protein CcmE n=1 Tax=Desulfitispora alkaliphila TaxID=622674 RepID=UPI003D206DFD